MVKLSNVGVYFMLNPKSNLYVLNWIVCNIQISVGTVFPKYKRKYSFISTCYIFHENLWYVWLIRINSISFSKTAVQAERNHVWLFKLSIIVQCIVHLTTCSKKNSRMQWANKMYGELLVLSCYSLPLFRAKEMFWMWNIFMTLCRNFKIKIVQIH